MSLTDRQEAQRDAGAVERAVERRRRPVDDAIAGALTSETPDSLYETCRHLPAAGGKRLRPAMLLLVAESLVGAGPEELDYRSVAAASGHTVDVLRAAASIEVLHTFTLIHDDLMDEDDMRRGAPAVHEAYDRPRAILAGDTLYAKAFELLADTGAPPERSARALSAFASTCTQICEGQSLDLAFETREPAGPEEYFEMVGDKTAALYAAAVSLPAVLLGHDDAVDPLAQYGRDVGRAFQIRDDLLDLTTPSERLGKQRGSDLARGKETLVTVHAREQGVDVDGLVAAESPETLDDAAVEAAVAELDAAGSIDYARRRADELDAAGKANLEVLPDNDARGCLEAITDYLVERGY